MQTLSLTTELKPSRTNKSSEQTVSYVSVGHSTNTPSNEFEWDNILDESFTKDFLDANGNLIQP